MVHLLEHLSFWLRYPSFLLSKFASQLKLIQSVARVEKLGICVTSSVLWVLLSRFWVSGSQVSSAREPVPGSWVSGSHVPGSQFQGSWCQGPLSQGPRVRESQSLMVLGSRVPRSRVPGLRSSFYTMPPMMVENLLEILNKRRSQTFYNSL